MNTFQYRHEYKFRLNALDVMALRPRLSAVLSHDPHAGADGLYHVVSLYFDDREDHALKEKLDGVSRRAKFRIRLYNDDDSFIRLEKKCKVGGLGTKLSERLSREETEKIIAGDLAWMAKDNRDLVRELYVRMRYGTFRPKTLVSYIREPFLYAPGNVRITLDSDIRSGRLSTDLFSGRAVLIPAAPGVTIMEVKYDQFLPRPVQDAIQTACRSQAAFSKYAACRTGICTE